IPSTMLVLYNFFNSFANCQPNEFYNFLKHLRTPAGQDELRKITVLEKLEEQATARGVTLKISDQQEALASFDCDEGNQNLIENHVLEENVPDGGGSSNA
ncbi:hypothetical protein A2U01_0056287, partial [Trifolium medium]|nr:hypothetical protein [Trifolium medium]